MAELRAFQPSFTAGELSPALWARVDLSKYGSGLKTAINLFIHPHGGASNRAGFEFVREVKNSASRVRLIPFQFNTEQTYVLEFGHQYFRVFKDGAIVLNGGSPYEKSTPYSEAHVGNLVFAQEADVMYIAHPNYPVYKLGRLADNNWTLTQVTFTPSINPPTGVQAQASFKYRSGDTSTFTFRVTSVSASGAESAASSSSGASFQWENDDGRYLKVTWNAVSGAVSYNVYLVSGVQGYVGTVFTNSIEFPSGDVVGNGSGPPGSSQPGAPAIPSNVKTTVEFGREQKYVVAAISEETDEESLPSAPASTRNDMAYKGNRNQITWNAVPGAAYYAVYREDNGVYGYVGKTETTEFVDENITPDTADGPQEGRNPFTGANNYPRCVTFVEQRLAFASSYREPQAVWLSQSGNYENFNVASPAKASDAITFRIRAREVNEIRSMLPLRGLMLLTSGAEWIVSGGSQSDAIAPNAIKIDNQGFRGSSIVQPVVVGNTVLFPQERGGVVRDFSYQFTDDAYVGKDLTILSRHMFEGKAIKAWAYAQAPHSIVWTVMNDGSLISLTYMKEHDVWAWTRHESGAGAQFEDVVQVAEGKEDAVYVLVRRNIGGNWKRYIERLHTREFYDVKDCFFVDSGLTYRGPAVNTVSGLGHLNGQEVVALADGNVVRGLTVSGGSVTLPIEASVIHVGLPYEATMQTLDLDLGNIPGLGTVQGRSKSISEVVLRVEQTRGIFVGPHDGDRDSDSLVEYKQRETEAWNEAIRLYTGDIHMTPHWDWTDGGNMWVKQFDPLPMTILAIMPDVTVGR